MSYKDYRLDDSLGHLIGSVSRHLSLSLDREFKEEGIDITSEQWSVLVSLWNKDGQCQHELATCQGKDRASITRLIDNLEKHNFVVRIPSDTDRRIKKVYLTNKGKELQTKLIDIGRNVISKATKGLENDDLRRFKSILKLLLSNLIHE